MIVIAGAQRPVDTTSWPQLAKMVYQQKRKSPVPYNYVSTHHLRFEMVLRTRIVEAAGALSRSGAGFSTFKNARCNELFWQLTNEGGFRLKDRVAPAAGIRDIFVNGRKYAFECATAVVIVLYRGILDMLRVSEFNRIFAGLFLYDWHYDPDLRLIQLQGTEHAYAGDIVYFDNPDVSPKTPQWRGENAVKAGDDLYYGHGIGIVPARKIISTLNRFRQPGSTRSAYFTDQVIHPDFLYLSRFAPGAGRSDSFSDSYHQAHAQP